MNYEIHLKFQSYLNERDHCEDLGIDGRIMLKWKLQTRISRFGVLIEFLYSFLSVRNISMYVFILGEVVNITEPFVTFLFFDL
jgi:hypothetical protein